MNQKQREYAVGRVNRLADRKVKEITAENTIPAVTLTNDEKKKLVAGGLVKLREDAAPDEYGYLFNCFDYSDFEKAAVVNQKVIDTVTKAIQAQARTIIDQIMLGDAEEALALLTQFENGGK